MQKPPKPRFRILFLTEQEYNKIPIGMNIGRPTYLNEKYRVAMRMNSKGGAFWLIRQQIAFRNPGDTTTTFTIRNYCPVIR